MTRESLSQPGGTNELSSSITTEFFCNEHVLVHVHMQSRASGQGSVSAVHLSSIQPVWCVQVLVGRAYLSLGVSTEFTGCWDMASPDVICQEK